MNSDKWIDFAPVRPGKVICQACGKIVDQCRMARGAHAAWHLKQRKKIEPETTGDNLVVHR